VHTTHKVKTAAAFQLDACNQQPQPRDRCRCRHRGRHRRRRRERRQRLPRDSLHGRAHANCVHTTHKPSQTRICALTSRLIPRRSAFWRQNAPHPEGDGSRPRERARCRARDETWIKRVRRSLTPLTRYTAERDAVRSRPVSSPRRPFVPVFARRMSERAGGGITSNRTPTPCSVTI
jgi:hypothetical protein